MAVSDYLKPGLHQKTAVTIITVNVAERYIEARLRDGAVVHVLVGAIPTVFRWPKVGEIWTIWKENGYWKLAERIESNEDGVGRVENFKEGDTQISGTVYIEGSLAGRTYTTKLDVPTQKSFVINHNLNTPVPTVSLWESEKSFALSVPATQDDTFIYTTDNLSGFDSSGLIWFPKTQELVKYAGYSGMGTAEIACERGYANTTPFPISKNDPAFKVREPIFNDVSYVLDENSILIELPSVLSDHDPYYLEVRVSA